MFHAANKATFIYIQDDRKLVQTYALIKQFNCPDLGELELNQELLINRISAFPIFLINPFSGICRSEREHLNVCKLRPLLFPFRKERYFGRPVHHFHFPMAYLYQKNEWVLPGDFRSHLITHHPLQRLQHVSHYPAFFFFSVVRVKQQFHISYSW